MKSQKATKPAWIHKNCFLNSFSMLASEAKRESDIKQGH